MAKAAKRAATAACYPDSATLNSELSTVNCYFPISTPNRAFPASAGGKNAFQAGIPRRAVNLIIVDLGR